MTCQITVDDSKASAFIAFLRELEFVKISTPDDVPHELRQPISDDEPLPGFGAFPDWEFIDRKKEHAKRTGGW